MLAASCGVSRALSACWQCFHGATTALLAVAILLGMISRNEWSAAGQFSMMLAWIWC